MGCATVHFLATQEGSKGQISLNLNYKVNFKDKIFKQTLYVFSQTKDTKLTKQDFHLVTWVGLGGAGGRKFHFS